MPSELSPRTAIQYLSKAGINVNAQWLRRNIPAAQSGEGKRRQYDSSLLDLFIKSGSASKGYMVIEGMLPSQKVSKFEFEKINAVSSENIARELVDFSSVVSWAVLLGGDKITGYRGIVTKSLDEMAVQLLLPFCKEKDLQLIIIP